MFYSIGPTHELSFTSFNKNSLPRKCSSYSTNLENTMLNYITGILLVNVPDMRSYCIIHWYALSVVYKKKLSEFYTFKNNVFFDTAWESNHWNGVNTLIVISVHNHNQFFVTTSSRGFLNSIISKNLQKKC